jgi:hypothetical protein
VTDATGWCVVSLNYRQLTNTHWRLWIALTLNVTNSQWSCMRNFVIFQEVMRMIRI